LPAEDYNHPQAKNKPYVQDDCAVILLLLFYARQPSVN
jgi:hypothetical protein